VLALLPVAQEVQGLNPRCGQVCVFYENYCNTRNIRDLISNVVDSGVGCEIADQILNILAYADDIVLLAPS